MRISCRSTLGCCCPELSLNCHANTEFVVQFLEISMYDPVSYNIGVLVFIAEASATEY
jgi:hypothetical protein